MFRICLGLLSRFDLVQRWRRLVHWKNVLGLPGGSGRFCAPIPIEISNVVLSATTTLETILLRAGFPILFGGHFQGARVNLACTVFPVTKKSGSQ